MKIYKKGDYLAKEGEDSEIIFILLTGRLGIYKGSMKIAEFNEKGIIVGEMSAILGEKRTASIKALEDSTVILINSDLDNLIKKYPDMSKKIMINLAERLKKTTEEHWFLASEVNARSYEKNTG